MPTSFLSPHQLGTTSTKTLMNEDAAPLGIDMIIIRACDTRLLKPGECTVFISPKHYSDINEIVLGLLMNLKTKLYTPICAWQIKPGKSSKDVLRFFSSGSTRKGSKNWCRIHGYSTKEELLQGTLIR